MSPFAKYSDGQSVGGILASYFMVEHLAGNGLNESTHQEDLSMIAEWYPHWEETHTFIEDTFEDDRFQQKLNTNPFSKEQSFDFKDMVRVTRTIGEQVGSFSNHECHDMKFKLAEMDIHGTGRVKLADFYREGV